MSTKVNVVSAAVKPRLRLNLVTSEDIRKGDVIFRCSPDEIQRERTWRTMQIDANRHIKNEFLDYVDHSCEPNALFDIERLSFVALRDIARGEPVTFFYPGAEVELAQDFVCQCRSSDCLGHITGGFYLTHRQMQWALDRGYCTAFMKAQFLRLLDPSR